MSNRHPLLLASGLVFLFAPVWIFLLDRIGLAFGTADPLNIALALACLGGALLSLSQRGSWTRILATLAIGAVVIVAQFYAVAALVAATI